MRRLPVVSSCAVAATFVPCAELSLRPRGSLFGQLPEPADGELGDIDLGVRRIRQCLYASTSQAHERSATQTIPATVHEAPYILDCLPPALLARRPRVASGRCGPSGHRWAQQHGRMLQMQLPSLSPSAQAWIGIFGFGIAVGGLVVGIVTWAYGVNAKFAHVQGTLNQIHDILLTSPAAQPDPAPPSEVITLARGNCSRCHLVGSVHADLLAPREENETQHVEDELSPP